MRKGDSEEGRGGERERERSREMESERRREEEMEREAEIGLYMFNLTTNVVALSMLPILCYYIHQRYA